MSQPYVVTVQFQPTVLGDEWAGASVGPVVVNGISQGTLSRITLRFVGPNSPTPFIFDSTAGADGLIVIDNAGTWEAHIDPTTPFLNRAGDWKWDMKFYSNGDVSPLTCYQGVLTVLPTTNP